MNISVVTTCYNEEDNIKGCLDSLTTQNYFAGQYEIIISDGNSTDNTGKIVREYADKFNNIKLVIEPKKGTAAGRNAGIRAAEYDYIAFIDADCIAPEDWLTILADNYQRGRAGSEELAAVGGRNIPPQDTGNFVKAIAIVLDSYPGSFGSIQGRQFKKPVLVTSLSTVNALYDKSKILSVNCFDETLKSEAEDADLNYRLFARGNKFLFIPDSFVWHKMRVTPWTWLKNMFRYGKGRARLLKRYPGMWHISFLLPILFLTAMAIIPLGLVFKAGYLPLLYFPGIFLFSIGQCIYKRSLSLIFLVTCIYIIQHFGYACGQVYGLINYKIK